MPRLGGADGAVLCAAHGGDSSEGRAFGVLPHSARQTDRARQAAAAAEALAKERAELEEEVEVRREEAERMSNGHRILEQCALRVREHKKCKQY